MENCSLFETSPMDTAIDQLHEATAIYTCQPIVDRMLDRIEDIWPQSGKCLIDTSCGDGQFIGQAVRRLLDKYGEASPDDVSQMIEGWEIHPYAAEEARMRVADILMEYGWGFDQARATASAIITTGDFLTGHNTPKRYAVITGNPPYLRLLRVPQLLRKAYEAITPAYAMTDLLHSFIDKIVRILEPDGQIALVTADRWLFNDQAAMLREAIGQSVSISHVERLDVNTAFYRPKIRKAGTPPRVHPVIVILGQKGNGLIPLDKGKIHPDAIGEPEHTGRTLKDVAEVYLCPWVGRGFGPFVVDEATARKLPPEYLVPAVDTDDMKGLANGMLLSSAQRYAIRTYPGIEPHPVVVDHIRKHLDKLPATGKRHRDYWLPPESFHRRSFDREVFLVPRISEGLRYVRLAAGLLGLNHNISVVAADPQVMPQVEALLQSEEAQNWIRSRAPRLEGGYCSITTKLLRELPVDF